MTTEVLMVGWGYPPDIAGGLDVHVAETFERTPTEDVSMTLVLPERNAPDHPDVEAVSVRGETFLDEVSSLADTVADIATEYDVIHTHDWFGYEPGLRASMASDATWIATLHSLASDRNVRPSRRELNVERRLVESVDHLLAVSEQLADEVEIKHGTSPRVIHNGFPQVEASGVTPSTFDPDVPTVLFVGRHAEQKGIGHLIYGFRKVIRQRDAQLVVAGTGPRSDQLRRFAELVDIDDHVEFPGFVPHDELADYYAAADVFVSPSLSEPFGLTLAEALSVDTPVVATESGIEELLPEECIVSVEPHSDAIAEGVLDALDRDDVPEFEPYTWDEAFEELAALYRSVN